LKDHHVLNTIVLAEGISEMLSAIESQGYYIGKEVVSAEEAES
jgi:hypothetical protein